MGGIGGNWWIVMWLEDWGGMFKLILSGNFDGCKVGVF